MKYKIVICLLATFFNTVTAVHADLTGSQKIRDHIDQKLIGIDIQNLNTNEREFWLVDPYRLNINMLVPIYGSTILDNTLYGDIRPPAYIFDWALGGLIPLGLLLTAGLAGDKLSSGYKRSMVSAALGLYLITRVAVLITINEHIHEYNKYMKIRMGLITEDTSTLNIRLNYEKKF